MGDPETEVVMPRLKSDLVGLFLAMENCELATSIVQIESRAAATVVLVSGGYPSDFEKGMPIMGLDENFSKDTLVFYAGITAKNSELLTSGGRVAVVTSYGNTIEDAVHTSLQAIGKIKFEKMSFRRDIGYEFKI